VLDQKVAWEWSIYHLLVNMLIWILLISECGITLLMLVHFLVENENVGLPFSLVIILCLLLMDFEQVSLKRMAVILKIISTEIICWNVICLICEEKINFILFLVMTESTNALWVSALMALK
jgi:uncharacterized membrane protein YccC